MGSSSLIPSHTSVWKPLSPLHEADESEDDTVDRDSGRILFPCHHYPYSLKNLTDHNVAKGPLMQSQEVGQDDENMDPNLTLRRGLRKGGLKSGPQRVHRRSLVNELEYRSPIKFEPVAPVAGTRLAGHGLPKSYWLAFDSDLMISQVKGKRHY